MSKRPDRFYVNKGDRTVYNNLVNNGFFKDKNRRDQFFFAMAFGFDNDIFNPLDEKGQDGFFRTTDLRTEDSTMLSAIALVHSKVDIEDLSAEEIFKIAEGYAHAGILVLKPKIESYQYGSVWKHLEKELNELYEKFDIND